MMIDNAGIAGPVVNVTTPFRAPRAKVFKTWTDATLIPKWFMVVPGYLPALASVDLRELGGWKITVRPEPDKNHTTLEGNFLEVKPNERLTYSWRGNVAGGEYITLVDVRFEDDGEGALLRLSHGVFESEPDRAAHEGGWNMCLSGLHALLEGMP